MILSHREGIYESPGRFREPQENSHNGKITLMTEIRMLKGIETDGKVFYIEALS